MNAVVGQMLRCTIHSDKSGNWDLMLPTIEMTINSLPNSSTGYSPFFLNYGYHPVLPVELLKGDENVSLESVDNFVERIQKEWKLAREHLLQSVKKQQMYYNRQHRDIEYRVGDLVLLSTKNLKFKNVPVKLQKRFVGPFEVVEKIGAQAYKLQLPNDWTIHNVFHVSLLKKWKTSVFCSEDAAPTEALEVEDHGTKKAERILRWKRSGRHQPPAYLILWQGSPLDEATWEKADQFDAREFREWITRDLPPEDSS